MLNLQPLPNEGGFYRETHKSHGLINISSLPDGDKSDRAMATCIYYMITESGYSRLHKLPTEEIWHFYLGDPIEQLQLFPDGSSQIITIGNDLKKGELPQLVVSKNIWQGSRLKQGGTFALVGATMSPGFEFEDLIMGNEKLLKEAYPSIKGLISKYV